MAPVGVYRVSVAWLLTIGLIAVPICMLRLRQRLPEQQHVHRALADANIWHQQYLERRKHSGVVIYNRVGKCGSTSMVRLLDRLQREKKRIISHHLPLKFWGHAGPEVLNRWLHTTKKAEAQAWATNRTVVLDGHSAWVNYTEHGYPAPVFINVVREPISRMKSIFYYMHAPMRHNSMRSADALARLMGDAKHDPQKHTLSNCLRVPRCHDYVAHKYAAQPVRQFRGMAPEKVAITPYPAPEATVAQAVHNLRNEYLVVIPLQELEPGLQLLECLLPKEFKGALKIFKEADASSQNANHNTQAVRPPSEDLDALTEMVTNTGETQLWAAALERFCFTWRVGQQQCRPLRRVAVPTCDSLSEAASAA
ncbi:hypothetical protein JKP88DRAFT_252792 [Tribonema minus]|uniref:Uncharacterized protein n=1 Tax=Tribonema minus TaxID=303371 RepID=A0A835Z9J9_9STRA|nr:hypothetical protein JKP88DRAFT_252792 [Tribonema minus]